VQAHYSLAVSEPISHALGSAQQTGLVINRPPRAQAASRPPFSAPSTTEQQGTSRRLSIALEMCHGCALCSPAVHTHHRTSCCSFLCRGLSLSVSMERRSYQGTAARASCGTVEAMCVGCGCGCGKLAVSLLLVAATIFSPILPHLLTCTAR